MKFLLFINLTFALIIRNKAAEVSGVYKDPKYPGKCAIDGIIMSPGDEVLNPKGECCRMFCGEDSWAVIQTCGLIIPPDDYKLGKSVDPTAPYPKCCNKHFVPIGKGKE